MFQLGLLSYLTPDSMPGKLHPRPPPPAPEKKPQTTKTKTTQELKNLS